MDIETKLDTLLEQLDLAVLEGKLNVASNIHDEIDLVLAEYKADTIQLRIMQ